jgi:hypothetical protein
MEDSAHGDPNPDANAMGDSAHGDPNPDANAMGDSAHGDPNPVCGTWRVDLRHSGSTPANV